MLVGYGVIGLLASVVAPYSPYEMESKSSFLPPSQTHLLGTDQFGRDILSRTLFGTRVSLRLSCSAVGIALLVGIPFGMVAGHRGGVMEAVTMRLTDLLMIFRTMILAIVLVVIIGPSEEAVIAALTVYLVPQFTRMARGLTISVKENEFIEAAIACGASEVRILARHIWPNIYPPLLVQASLMLPTTVLSAAALSFIGLGVQPPTPEWGAQLSSAREFLRVAPHLIMGPGMALFLFVLAANLAADGFRDLLDPKTRQGLHW